MNDQYAARIRFLFGARALFGLALCALLVIVVGCNKVSQPKTEIKGKVTYKGAPLPGGNMAFYSATPGSAAVTCAINPDGTFLVNGVTVGQNKVTVETESLKKNEVPQMNEAMMGGMSKENRDKIKDDLAKAKANNSGPQYIAIPKKYADLNKTTLSVDVKDGKQTIDIDLPD
jgi:hypothetical protein